MTADSRDNLIRKKLGPITLTFCAIFGMAGGVGGWYLFSSLFQ